MRISDWSSDVCSAVLLAFKIRHRELADAARFLAEAAVFAVVAIVAHHEDVAGGHGVDAGVVGDGVAAVDRLEAFAARQRLAVALIAARSEEHTSELQSLMRISYAVFCLKKKKSTLIEPSTVCARA